MRPLFSIDLDHIDLGLVSQVSPPSSIAIDHIDLMSPRLP